MCASRGQKCPCSRSGMPAAPSEVAACTAFVHTPVAALMLQPYPPSACLPAARLRNGGPRLRLKPRQLQQRGRHAGSRTGTAPRKGSRAQSRSSSGRQPEAIGSAHAGRAGSPT